MTDYCTVANVEAKIKGTTFSATTVVKESEVEEFIAYNSAYIDGRLNTVYEVPITGAGALLIMKKICLCLTVPEVQEILGQGLGRLKEGEKDTKESCPAQAFEMLNQIETGELELPDATAKTANDFYNSNVADGREPTVKKDETQW